MRLGPGAMASASIAACLPCSSSSCSRRRSAHSVFIASLITKDNSWVDRLWSIVPVVYVWVFAIAAGLTDVRLDVMAGLVTLWGARLTFNFARKGGYTGSRGLPLAGAARRG